MPDKKIRIEPRISVSKLAEYMVATPARRRSIIRDQKHPLTFVAGRYSEVYKAVAECLRRGYDVTPVHQAIERLYKAIPKTNWQAQDQQLSAEALEAFLTFVDEVDFGSLVVTRSGDNAPLMRVAGVDVSVRPELQLRTGDSSALAGAVKLYLSKLFPFDEKASEYAGTVVHQYAHEVLGSAAAKIDPKNCYVIDIFARRVHVAPRTFKQRRKDVEAACEEIAQRWPSF